MESFIVDQAAHTLHSAAILFLKDRGGRDYNLYTCMMYAYH